VDEKPLSRDNAGPEATSPQSATRWRKVAWNEVGFVSLKGVQLAVRAGLAASLSLVAAQAFHLERPIFACLAAIIVTDLTPAETRKLGLRRLGAMLVGGATGASLSSVFATEPWAIGASVLITILMADLLRAREGAKIAGYVCGLIVLEDSAAPWHYGLHRVIETALGVTVAWLISYVPKLIRIDEAPKEKADP
jgi:uncharacterized membrane protein YgaE (UPF0421/DUF939 family)